MKISWRVQRRRVRAVFVRMFAYHCTLCGGVGLLFPWESPNACWSCDASGLRSVQVAKKLRDEKAVLESASTGTPMAGKAVVTAGQHDSSAEDQFRAELNPCEISRVARIAAFCALGRGLAGLRLDDLAVFWVAKSDPFLIRWRGTEFVIAEPERTNEVLTPALTLWLDKQGRGYFQQPDVNETVAGFLSFLIVKVVMEYEREHQSA